MIIMSQPPIIKALIYDLVEIYPNNDLRDRIYIQDTHATRRTNSITMTKISVCSLVRWRENQVRAVGLFLAIDLGTIAINVIDWQSPTTTAFLFISYMATANSWSVWAWDCCCRICWTRGEVRRSGTSYRWSVAQRQFLAPPDSDIASDCNWTPWFSIAFAMVSGRSLLASNPVDCLRKEDLTMISMRSLNIWCSDQSRGFWVLKGNGRTKITYFENLIEKRMKT